MALEGKFTRLHLWCVLEPLDGNATLNTACCVAQIVGHACDGACQIAQRRLTLLPWLQFRAAVGKELLYGVERVDVDDAARHRYDHLGRADGERLRLSGKGNSDRRA